jgi:hypothetical protein
LVPCDDESLLQVLYAVDERACLAMAQQCVSRSSSFEYAAHLRNRLLQRPCDERMFASATALRQQYVRPMLQCAPVVDERPLGDAIESIDVADATWQSVANALLLAHERTLTSIVSPLYSRRVRLVVRAAITQMVVDTLPPVIAPASAVIASSVALHDAALLDNVATTTTASSSSTATTTTTTTAAAAVPTSSASFASSAAAHDEAAHTAARTYVTTNAARAANITCAVRLANAQHECPQTRRHRRARAARVSVRVVTTQAVPSHCCVC